MKTHERRQVQVQITPGRSQFDAARWRCFGSGEGCGVWYSVHVKPWEAPREVAIRRATEHVEAHP